MRELRLLKNDSDKKLAELEGIGSLRMVKRLRGDFDAEADGVTWHLKRRGLYSIETYALDPAGNEVADYSDRGRGKSVIVAGDRTFPLRQAKRKAPYVLFDGDRELVA